MRQSRRGSRLRRASPSRPPARPTLTPRRCVGSDYGRRPMTTLVGNIHPEFRAFWHPVAWSREVADEPVATTLLGEPLVAVRRPTGEVAVFFDECRAPRCAVELWTSRG